MERYVSTLVSHAVEGIIMYYALHRMKSVSRMARKMYGDVVPGELTHADMALQYKNYFKEQHRALPKALPAVEKYKVWEMTSKIIQVRISVALN